MAGKSVAGRPPKPMKVDESLTEIGAADLAGLMAEGTVSAEEVAESYLAHIAAIDGEIGAFAHLDPDLVRQQAKALDRHRRYQRPLGPLHGVPVAVKDVVDVKGLPCENGTVIDEGRRPQKDASSIARLREAGAVILGKTVTAELATYHPGKTRNPLDPTRTPGGSSSGSAAAVAANMAPLAVATQTNASVIRPASFCGIVGYKPSRAMISRHGALVQSPTLDTIGLMGRSLKDVCLMGDVMAGFDAMDPAMQPQAPPRLAEFASSEPPVAPKFAFVPTPVWNEAEEDTRAGFEELVGELGDLVGRADLPGSFANAHAMHRAIHLADIARNYARYEQAGVDRLSKTLQELIEEGKTVTAVDYIAAQEGIDILNRTLEEILSRFSAIITPAAPGQAPVGLDSTGNPVFGTLWTYSGVPAITLPLLVGADNMPIGVQLIGRRGEDGRLMRTANWLLHRLREH